MACFSILSSGDLSYVDPIPPTFEIECPVCFGILFEPYLSDCCGHHFCGRCMPRLRNNPCPLCKKRLSTMLNQYLQRQIKSVKIYCPQKQEGCEWTGELNFISHVTSSVLFLWLLVAVAALVCVFHMIRSFKNKHEQEECKYILLKCGKGCGKKVQRILMDEHQTQHCLKRLVKCLYCSDSLRYNSVNLHLRHCPEVTINCPNGCQTEITRRILSEHMKDCPLEEVECEFIKYGCKWKQKRKQLESHLNESWKLHNSFVIESFNTKIDSFNTKISSQQEIISALSNQVSQLIDLKKIQDTRIKTLEDNVGRLRAEFEESKVDNDDDDDDDNYDDNYEQTIKWCDSKFYVADFSARKLRYEDCCLCPIVYIDRPGYKLRLVVQAGGVGFAKGTHVSVFIRFLRGNYDSQLHWPFTGEITIRLCDEMDGPDYYERTIIYTNETPRKYAEIAPGYEDSKDFGILDYISYEQLEEDYWLHCNDRLTFEITRIAYKDLM